MSAVYQTVKQSEAHFLDYLWGRSNEVLKPHQRALPIKTYHLGTPEESITFEIQNISEIIKPNVLLIFSALIKLNSFSVILFPLLFVAIKNYNFFSRSDVYSFILAGVASIFLFAGLNIRNDIFDHISGFDRVNIDANVKPIRKGWISAYHASVISLILIVISAFFAIPVMFSQSKILVVIGFALCLFIIGRFTKNNSYKQQHFGEILLMFLVGPILASGYQISLGWPIDVEILSFGVLWGFVVFYLIQVNNFSHLMTSSQAGIRNTMTKLGFDGSQKFLLRAGILCLLFWSIFYYHFTGIYRTVFSCIFLCVSSISFFSQILNIKSPMGSDLQRVRQHAYKVFLMMILIYIGGFFIETSFSYILD